MLIKQALGYAEAIEKRDYEDPLPRMQVRYEAREAVSDMRANMTSGVRELTVRGVGY